MRAATPTDPSPPHAPNSHEDFLMKAAKASFTAAVEMDQAHAGAQQRLAEVKRMLRKSKKRTKG